MLSGLQEIIIILVLLGIIFSHRMLVLRNKDTKLKIPYKEKINLTQRQRFFIVVSLIWITSFAIYFKPWNDRTTEYIIVGLGPVILFWSFSWIKAGVE